MANLRLNSRQVAILLTLLSENLPISAEELGTQVGISTRTIRYNLPRIQPWLYLRGVQLISKPGSGITLEISDALRRQLQKELHQEEFFTLLTAEDRQTLLMFELLVHGDYRKREDLASCLFTSTATLSRDLQDVEACLHEFQLTLKRKPHVGVKVTGQESAIRNRLLSLLFETGLESALLHMSLWGTPRSQLDGTSHFPVQEHILKETLGWDLPNAWRWISLLRQKLNASFSETAHLHLALIWAVMVRRIRAGHIMEPLGDPAADQYRERQEREAVDELARQFFHETGTQLPPSDLAYLTLEIMTTPNEYFDSRLKTSSATTLDGSMVESVNLLVQNVSNRLGRPWVRDEVRNQLTMHLQRIALRLRYDLPLCNPLTHQILTTYPDLRNAISESLLDLADWELKPLPLDEIANLTIYMALGFGLTDQKGAKLKPRIVVTCPKGGVAVWMLLSRIREELPEVEVVDVVPVSRLGRFDFSNIDAVVCTIQLELPGTQVITVSPILSEQDVDLLKHRLGLLGKAPEPNPA